MGSLQQIVCCSWGSSELIHLAFLITGPIFFVFSHVLAAYAHFLWETEEEEEEEEEEEAPWQDHIQPSLLHGAATSANA